MANQEQKWKRKRNGKINDQKQSTMSWCVCVRCVAVTTVQTNEPTERNTRTPKCRKSSQKRISSNEHTNADGQRPHSEWQLTCRLVDIVAFRCLHHAEYHGCQWTMVRCLPLQRSGLWLGNTGLHRSRRHDLTGRHTLAKHPIRRHDAFPLDAYLTAFLEAIMIITLFWRCAWKYSPRKCTL